MKQLINQNPFTEMTELPSKFLKSDKDNIFSDPLSTSAPFEFNERVANVFDDMIDRSVPLYREVQNVCAQAVKRFYQEGSTIYDLGCSTGTTIALIYSTLGANAKIIGVDNSQPMLDKCRTKLEQLNYTKKVELQLRDIGDVEIENASVVILNYTLQFLDVEERLPILKRIYNGLRKNGVLIISEKIISKWPELDEFLITLHQQFKARSGYSELEISQKRNALESVLVPLSISENLQMLNAAGFSATEQILGWYNFATILAKK